MKGFRKWLPADSFEGAGSLGGSFVSEKISDYYVDPIELGYGNLIHYGHEFVGRDALRELHDNQRRTKVTLVWNNEDVFTAIREALVPAGSVEKEGKHIGISQRMSFSSNAGAILSQAIVDMEHAQPGTEAVLLWGEPNSRRKTVEAHEVRKIRVSFAPVPYYKKSIRDE